MNVTGIEADYSSTFAILDKSILVRWGWPLCGRSTYKSLDLYEKFTRLASIV